VSSPDDIAAVRARLAKTEIVASEMRGRAAGTEWAKNEATMRGLEAIEDLPGSWLSWEIGGDEAGEDDTLAACLEGHGYRPNASDVIQVTADDPFILGFLDCAREVLEAVRRTD
jgi:hypothetical protein